MTTENIIYKPLIDTEENLRLRLDNGEFGFSTSTSAIVFKGANGGTETFKNSDGASTKIITGFTLPTSGLENNLLFILIGTANDGLYRYSDSDLAWNIVAPLASATKNGRLTFTDFTKIQNIEQTATNITNTLVPEITATTGGKLSDVDAVKFASIDSDAEQNVRSVYTETDSTSDTFIFNKPTELANINSTEGAKLDSIKITDATQGNGLIVNNGVLSIDHLSISHTETFTTTTLRNADTTTLWSKGDIAIITGNNEQYIYTGTDQTTAGVTVNGDWTSLLASNAVTDVTLAGGSALTGSVNIPLANFSTNTTGLLSVATDALISSNRSLINSYNGRISTNETGISTNLGNITTNSGNITTNTGNISTNTGNISTNTNDISPIKTKLLTYPNSSLADKDKIISVKTDGTGFQLIENSGSVTTPISVLPIGYNADGTNNLLDGQRVNLNTQGLQIGGGAKAFQE